MTTFKFGVEIEFVDASTRDVALQLQRDGINAGLGGYTERAYTSGAWKVTTDQTVSDCRNWSTGEGYGGELVSPVLEGEQGFQELQRVLDSLNRVSNMRVDRRCGLHVHLSWDGMTVEWVQNVIHRYKKFEGTIDGWMAESRRGGNSRWCRGLSDSAFRDALSYDGDSLSRLSRLCSRYHKVNGEALDKHQTVEFRQHQGTTDYQKISNWIKFLIGFVKKSEEVTRGTLDNNAPYRKKRRAYDRVRHEFAVLGVQMEYRSQGVWRLTWQSGYRTRISNYVLESFYNDDDSFKEAEFQDYVQRLMANNVRLTTGSTKTIVDIENDEVFAGVDTEVADFLIARTNQLAS